MKKLGIELTRLKKSAIARIISKRLAEFASFKGRDSGEWFSELCFCILTANSKAKSALAIQSKLGTRGFCTYPESKVRQCIIDHKHRFHNNKAKYIVAARKHRDIKRELAGMDSVAAREWLVKSVKGLGYKEASHFMRNVGYNDVAIVDRHILSVLHKYGYIKSRPPHLTKNAYLDIEKTLAKIAKENRMSLAELDLYLWYMKTGEVLK